MSVRLLTARLRASLRRAASWRAVAATLGLLAAGTAHGQAGNGLQLVGANVQRHANAVLSLMAYSVVPDLTSSSLSINNASTDDPGVVMSQLGGGFTISKSFPLYLEGAIAYSRYDPTFIASNGTESRAIPTRWNTFSGTIGIGWDFPITANKELVIRPIFNFSLGNVSSDLSIGKFAVERVTDRQINFLDGGSLNAYGLGGSLMLDLEHYRENYEVDVELRYTSIHLQSFGGTTSSVTGTATAQTANLWARWRAPTGLYALDRPVRYVLELSHSHYFGSQAGILGFNYLTTLGTGLELDTSAHEVFVTRIRAVVRYVFGNNVSGVSLGLAASF
ncbi:hypothetical protein Tamer19_34640 [Cupriavidus sp. TA19]|uniref:hypothetical protein n=1 Tax=unclassified Cupriavidus TaxID=2640874 RepID=UPI000EEE0B92|nr:MULTISPECIES: hypothetical protein [unclassified Cupriavidus]BDB25840.1 autotransporter domain-containing protein [Cupriavidus sp. P-10]GLC94056.1 hypothetical protein Tamer19_34640 [Cupriavidus sp. TA19]